jgi:antitoxin component of MazEF toxin-antitoxin module
MATIDTTLTTSGNSTALRLSKELLRMSGLNSKSRVRLEVKKGRIVISKSTNPRNGWSAQIKALMLTEEDPAKEFANVDTASNDGLDNLTWEGPSFEDWLKSNGKLS